MRSLLAAFAILAVTPVLTATHLHATTPVVIGVPNWPSAQTTAHIIGDILEDHFNLETERRPMGTLGIFVGIEKGTVHIHPEVWLPNLQSVVAEHGGTEGLFRLSGNGVPASQNICTTPETVAQTGIKHVNDLTDPEMAAKFDTDNDGRGEIWIGARTWSSTLIERIRARSYGYDQTMRLLQMPEDVAMASVDAAIATDKPTVFFCYQPHHLFELHEIVILEEAPHDAGQWDIKLPSEDDNWLKNSKATTAWDKAHFHIGYASTFMEEAPEATNFIRNINFTPEDIAAMSYQVEVERKAPDEVARRWVKRHDARIKEWLK